jgi:transcriptional regulator with XRE-family HTH domain
MADGDANGERADERSDGDRRTGPAALRVALGVRLRRLREASGVTREAAGARIRASASKISRIELGRVSSKERDVADLLTAYGVTDVDERATLLDLGRRAGESGWWREFGDTIPPWFEPYLGLEQSASLIRTYEPQFVPGLLQTEDYARAVVSLGSPTVEPAQVDQRVRLRARRQQVLTGPNPPTLWAVLDEGALRRPLGGTKTQIDQLRHLLEMCELPHVTLQVVLFTHGGHAAAGGPFTLLRFSEPEVGDIVYLEQLTSAVYLERLADVEHYSAVMSNLAVHAQPPQHTPDIIRGMIDE